MELFNQQAQQIADAMSQQATVAEAALTAQGVALVEAMAAEALKRAQAAAAGAMAIRAQELLNGMAQATSSDLAALAGSAPCESEISVIEVKPVRIELPPAAVAALPQGQRMLNATSATPSKAARRRARRKVEGTED